MVGLLSKSGPIRPSGGTGSKENSSDENFVENQNFAENESVVEKMSPPAEHVESSRS